MITRDQFSTMKDTGNNLSLTKEFLNFKLEYLYFPLSRPCDHTMYFSLDLWAMQKIPMQELNWVALNNCSVEIHGVYPTLFSAVKKCVFKTIKEIRFSSNSRTKKYNFIRPKFFYCQNEFNEKILVIAVTPGRDYIFQYAGLVRHCLSLLTRNYDKLISIKRYPKHEENITFWTNLNVSFVSEKEVVIIGFVHEIQKELQQSKEVNLKFLSKYENDFYIANRYISGNKVNINFLGVKYSFWGCISARLISKICALGVQEIIYVGKLGSLNSYQDIYKKIFSPTKYMTIHYDKIINKVNTLSNNVVNYFPKLNTGLHISVSTVVEEDFVQRDILTKCKAYSIDNEISQIAYTINNYNNIYCKNILFSCMHFATDYLMTRDEYQIISNLNLSTNRSLEAIHKKQKMLENISQILIGYFLLR